MVLDNGGGGGGGGGDGKPGNSIPYAPKKSGGGGGAGQVFLGVDNGDLVYSGQITAYGGQAPSGSGGDGLLTLVVPDPNDLVISGGTFNGALLQEGLDDTRFLTDLPLDQYAPYGGGGGGGGGGAGGSGLDPNPQCIPEPPTGLLLAIGFGTVLWVLAFRQE